MSYLSELKAGKLSPGQFLKRSAGWLARLAGFTDANVDMLVHKADQLTDEFEDDAAQMFEAYIAKVFPAVPKSLREVAAVHAVQVGFKVIDASLAGLGETLKMVTPAA